MTNNFFPSFQSSSKKTSGAYTTGSSDPAVSPGRVAGGGERGGGEGGGERGGGGREEGKKKEEEGEERLRLTSELQEIERERLAQTFQLICLVILILNRVPILVASQCRYNIIASTITECMAYV